MCLKWLAAVDNVRTKIICLSENIFIPKLNIQSD